MGKNFERTQQGRERLTDKSRVLGQEENGSTRTGHLRSQEMRIVPHSSEETDKPSAEAKSKLASSSPQPPPLEKIPIHSREMA